MHLCKGDTMRYSRQTMILELISNYEIDTQEKLAALLRANGYNVTQATVSRDIKELQLIKVPSEKFGYKYASNTQTAPKNERFSKIFRETILSFEPAGNIVCVKTLSGCANAAAEAIDSTGLCHVVGSIAGDNTIFFLVDKDENVPDVVEQLKEMLSTK